MSTVEAATDARGTDAVVLRDGSGSQVVVHRHGAHVTSWRPAGGTEALFTSRAARFAEGEAIRGGIPVIFPQFAERGPLAKHGFARVRRWTVAEASGAGEQPPRVTLTLADDAATRAAWPHRFLMTLTVSLEDPRTLRTALAVENRGESAFAFTAALHTYLRVGDASRAVVKGLAGARSTEGTGSAPRDDGSLLVGDAVNRIHLEVPDEVVVLDPALSREFSVHREGFPDVVTWNPGVDGSRAIPDMAAGEHAEMLCVEPAVIGTPVQLQPGARWRGVQTLTARFGFP